MVYTSQFAFSVNRGNLGLNQVPGDNCLNVSLKDDNHYFSKAETLSYELKENYTRQLYRPIPDVLVSTVVIPCGSWHIRVHDVETDRAISISDGGFAVPVATSHRKDYLPTCLSNGKRFDSTIGIVACLGYDGYEKITHMTPEPGTNLLFPNTLILHAQANLDKGSHRLISAHFGGNHFEKPPEFTLTKDTIKINGFTIQLKPSARINLADN